MSLRQINSEFSWIFPHLLSTEPSESSERIENFVPPSSILSPTLAKSREVNEEEEEEEARMMNQARLAYWLRRFTAKRCVDQPSTAHSSDEQSWTRGIPTGMLNDDIPVELVMHEPHWVVKLTNVKILPRVGDTGLGTLEAHLNGFRYSTLGLHVDFMHKNVEGYFFRLGHGCPPLLQFRLQHPIKVGNKVAKDIQFCLVPTPVGKVRFDKDPGNVNSCRDEDLKNFVHKVQETQFTCGSRLPFSSVDFQALEEFEFYGDFPKGASATFALTNSAIVVLKETPFFVVPLREIEIVNLARLGTETIDMTVVFQDYERDVLEIHSIPLKFLPGIKHRLSDSFVKYYVNSLSPNWSNLVREIAEFPKKFVAKGGWDAFEDSLTLAYYPLAESYPEIPTVVEMW